VGGFWTSLRPIAGGAAGGPVLAANLDIFRGRCGAGGAVFAGCVQDFVILLFS